jgi:SAM-dependent methyltransferase
VIYQRPLAYLLGLEGVALLRAFAGEYDREFGEARIAEIRRLLDSPALGAEGVTAESVSTVAGYHVWAATYDQPGNGLFGVEEPVIHEILDALSPGIAVDAACGTGRHARHLVARGHRVIGVDSSPDMLAVARPAVPQAEFRPGDLHDLPLPDDHADVIVCALALVHLADLRPVFAEFARVLRPGGHLVVSDVHQEQVALGSVPRARSETGERGLLPAFRHRAADYLRAALPLGFEVRRCEEPQPPPSAGTPGDGVEAVDVGPWDSWPWSLLDIVPAARAAAFDNKPSVMVWHFHLADPGSR